MKEELKVHDKDIAEEKKVNDDKETELCTLATELTFKRIYARGLLFHKNDVSFINIRYSVLNEIPHNLLGDQFDSITLPDEHQLHNFFYEFDQSKKVEI